MSKQNSTDSPRRKPTDNYVIKSGGTVTCIDSKGKVHRVCNLTKSSWSMDGVKVGCLAELSRQLGFFISTYKIGLQLQQSKGYEFQKKF